MKTIISVLKNVLMIGAQCAPAVVGAYNPPLGALVGGILSSVINAEAKIGAGRGSDKKELALLGVQASMPAIQLLLEQAGKPIRNPALFAEAVEMVQEGIVRILNATGDNAKPEAAA